jgi:transcriptional regulator with XRE-family HTH domain
MTESEFKEIVAYNIIFFRRKKGLTQLQLAEKLNYSDKAISKWERAESLPDAYTLQVLADFFEISLNDFLVKHRRGPLLKTGKAKLLISLLSATLVWVIATSIYVVCAISFSTLSNNIWLVFLWAIPACAIVLTVFSYLWGKPWIQLIAVSFILWGITIALYITLITFASGNLWWLILIGAIPVQLLFILWYIFRHIKKPKVE